MKNFKKASMKDWNNLTEIEQNQVILNIMSRLEDKQEIWYWEGLVYSYKTLQERIDKAIAYIKSEKAIQCSGIPIKNFEIYENTLLDILNGSDDNE